MLDFEQGRGIVTVPGLSAVSCGEESAGGFWVGMLCENGSELVEDFGLIGGEVLGFEWVGLVVVEFEFGGFRGCAGHFPFNEAVAFGADGTAECLLGEAVEGVVANAGIRVFENGHETESVDGLWA